MAYPSGYATYHNSVTCHLKIKSMLFKEVSETDETPQERGETTYDYLCRSSYFQAKWVKDTLNIWYSKIKVEDRSEIERRIKTEFESIFSEMLIHNLFTNLGYELEEHPEIIGTTKRPDFKAENGDDKIYLEVKIVNDESTEESAIKKVRESIYQQIDDIKSPNYFFNLSKLSQKKKGQPSLKKFKAQVAELIAKSDPEEDEKKFQDSGYSNLPTLNYEDENIRIEIQLIPRVNLDDEYEDKGSIGLYDMKSWFGTPKEAIKKGVKKKATRYGSKMDLPFIVCIQCSSDRSYYEQDVETGLYGDTWQDITPGEERTGRDLNGSFTTNGGQYSRVSAVLSFSTNPYNLYHTKYCLFLNPNANHKIDYSGVLRQCEMVDQENVKYVEGKSLFEILDIADEWKTASNKW